jgi:hypothetical protein
VNNPIPALRFSPQALRRTTPGQKREAESSGRFSICSFELPVLSFECIFYIISFRTSSGGMAMTWMVVSPSGCFTATCTGDILGALL